MRSVFVLSAILALATLEVTSESCENGNEVHKLGVDSDNRQVIVNEHNKYRLQIARGEVSGQPQGHNLQKVEYDETLGAKAREVSLQCEMKHKTIYDDRWPGVGQNLYIEFSSSSDPTQNWEEAIAAWFDECKDYNYGSPFSSETGHYTQVVWADTNKVGCDFIMYKDDNSDFPYQKFYTCNYGPAGNYQGDAPYEIKGSHNCDDYLC